MSAAFFATLVDTRSLPLFFGPTVCHCLSEGVQFSPQLELELGLLGGIPGGGGGPESGLARRGTPILLLPSAFCPVGSTGIKKGVFLRI
jgi:hypothetical protein